MARNIGADGSDVYRAVITLGDSTTPRYEGPYNSPGAARARVSFWRNHLAKSGSSATGHVERADTVWRPLDEPPQPDPPTAPQPAPAAALTADERQFLTFALDRAADHMAERGDEFTAADEAALEALRRLTRTEEPTP